MILIGIERDFKIFCFKIVSILGNTNAWGILCHFHPLKHWWVSKILIYPRAYTKEPSSFKKNVISIRVYRLSKASTCKV